MASQAPQSANLPLLYRDLVPISLQEHATWRYRTSDTAPFLKTEHAIPVTTEEFAFCQRHYPIVFSAGDSPVPLVLMALNEGINTFVDDEGAMIDPAVYVPAYIRRYPFLLAKLRPDAEEMSLCIDPTSGVMGEYDEGDLVFEGDQPSENTKNVLAFCEQFEQAGQMTGNFMNELKSYDLLMEGEMSIQPDADAPPFVYRGFQMVNEEKLRDLRGDQLRKMMQNGMLPLVHAHLFSLNLMRDIFARQVAQGKMPVQQPA